MELREGPVDELLHPSLSVVVPTKGEADNVGPLVERLHQALGNVPFEVIFVDDSDDETPERIESISARQSVAIDLIHRPPDQRGDGLGGAVVVGMRRARAPWICVMDGDLQHPPELVPELFRQAEQTPVDLVLASRYADRGRAGLSPLRAAASRVTTTAARLMFPIRLRHVTDPMSGFFLIRKSAFELDKLQPRGFKILLEILVRSPKMRIVQVGFEFGKRQTGQSKASISELMIYLSQLWKFRFSEDTRRFSRFLTVGAVGLLINTLALVFTTEIIGLFYLVGVLAATQCSTAWNYIFTEVWVFNDRHSTNGRIQRPIMYFAMNNAALGLRGPMIYILTSVLGIHLLVSNLVSLIALMVLRYGVADALIWRRIRPRERQDQPFGYDIHGIISVTSDVRLPELEAFLVDLPQEHPTIQVYSRRQAGPSSAKDATTTTRFTCDDGFGPLGFRIDVSMGETIEVLASPLLRHSPHVLYTNVVEPILRWEFVKRGFALVHGACIAFGTEGYLVTARTDTGKTTTILRILSRQRRLADPGGFLSDDLTLVTPDGLALTYPKPLTISRHTVAAIRTSILTRKERLSLIVQSRVHSRGGRRFAFLLTKSYLPVATINTIAQLIVPPPKYHIQRLVPPVKLFRQARLAGIFIIERGGEGEVELDERTALNILFQNCEDAYGFPPYHTIERYLRYAGDQDLGQAERAIVAEAFKGCPTTLLRSTTMDWSERMPAFVNVTARGNARAAFSLPTAESSASSVNPVPQLGSTLAE